MQKLYTAAGEHLPEIPWNDYPRPQLVRRDWLCLNGRWELTADGKTSFITVPFCPESLLSGIAEPPKCGTWMVYRRTFAVPAAWDGRHIRLHFGAVMRRCEVLVNGRTVTEHENGYLSFTVDITNTLRPGENELTVRVCNDLDHRYPWGKQKVERGGMWYTPVSGIWQSVWLEPVPEQPIERIRVKTQANRAFLTVEGVQSGTVVFAGREIPFTDGHAELAVEDPVFWTPETPQLYWFTIITDEDRVESYFALRELTVEPDRKGIPRLCLNGKPYFFHGLLDQGYWSDGLYTPAAPELYEQDILAMKARGFNTLRKHIKIELERFYYDCDRLGIAVFQDMVNAGDYRFWQDTALPTAGFLKRGDKNRHRDPVLRRFFYAAMEGTVRQLENHPSIVYWTIFNEGWGQFCADKAYEKLKSLDTTRFIDATSGWFAQTKSDVESLHIYFGRLHLGRDKTRPQVLSEYGGYVWKAHAHSFNTEKTYGYRIYKEQKRYAAALCTLFQRLRPLVEQGLCAAIYTQVSDVEDETNGLLTFDRRVQKADPAQLRPIADELQKALE